mgnify:CR=1 FL=1
MEAGNVEQVIKIIVEKVQNAINESGNLTEEDVKRMAADKAYKLKQKKLAEENYL